MIRISSLFLESFCKCQNCYAMFWKFRGGKCSKCPPWLRACSPLSKLTVSLHYLCSLACSKTQSDHVKIRCHVIVTQ